MKIDSELNDIVPYQTGSGLQIGRSYRPPKIYGSGEDILDLSDSYMIQSALIADNGQYRRERIVDVLTVTIAIVFVAVVVMVL
jgi:hypothetical protein